MRLYLINPCNPLVSTVKARENRWNRYTVWKPLGLLVLAGLTPDEWEITIFDENRAIPDYAGLPRPDLVGITAFTSQANRAYELAAEFCKRKAPVVMGGIHATMCSREAAARVDSVVRGEAESVWARVIDDCRNGSLKKIYQGARLDLDKVPAARHDLLSHGYSFGSIQTSRGCPLACSFCSVTAFNGGRFRRRPVENVIREFRLIREKYVLIVDDNLIGTRKEHIDETKKLLREIIRAKLRKQWIAQVTINMADDQELLALAKKAGCIGVFVGFESISAEGMNEISKKFAIANGRDIKASVRRIQHHGISVLGSFIVGLDIDMKGIGDHIAKKAEAYGLDVLNVMLLTPLPGTRLWETMLAEDRIVAGDFPRDWQYYTLTFPVAHYKHLSWRDMMEEKEKSYRAFYSYARILGRVIRSVLQMRNPWIVLASNLLFRTNTLRLDREGYRGFDSTRDQEHIAARFLRQSGSLASGSCGAAAQTAANPAEEQWSFPNDGALSRTLHNEISR
jgi:radical SAM superfamily enzyme YgiQ (UPF0313 family)